jgi:HPt (histidine-containing phosphotransfer) domain-containing protein
MSDSIEALRRENQALREQLASRDEALLDARDELERVQSQHDVLENFVFGLEREHERARAAVERTRAELEASYAELQQLKQQQDDILSSIDQGLLTIGSDLKIAGEHSRAALQILGRETLGGLELPELFAHDPTLADAVRRFATLALETVHASDAMLARLSPIREVRMPVPDGGERVLSFGVVRVRSRADGRHTVARLLVVVDDRTYEDRLQRELAERTREQQERIQRAYQILITPPAMFTDLIEDGRSAVEEVRARRTSEPPARLMRAVHTLKGNARALGMDTLAASAHALEDALVARDDARTAKETMRVEAELRDGVALFEQLVQVREAVQHQTHDRASELEAALRRAAENEARQRGVVVALEWHEAIDDARAAKAVAITRSALIAMVRNAVAHGGERPEERRAAGKPESLTIEVRLETEGDRVVVACRDDGRGIDDRRVIERAIALGSIDAERARSLEHESTLALLLGSGLSTADSVGMGAGRGVGLDIVREIAEALGGSVRIASELGRGTDVAILFPASALLEWGGSPTAPREPSTVSTADAGA